MGKRGFGSNNPNPTCTSYTTRRAFFPGEMPIKRETTMTFTLPTLGKGHVATTLMLSAAILGSGLAPVSAETLRWARAGDSLTLDPHAQNEGPTHTLAHQIYEPLIIRDMSGAFQPALATDWAPKPGASNVWVFNLRQ